MSDTLGYKVGDIIWSTYDLYNLPVGTQIGHNPAYDEDDPDYSEENWVRTVNGYTCILGNSGTDAGHFVANEEISEYFQPGMNMITHLDEPEEVDPIPVINVTQEEFDRIKQAKVEPTGCDCGNCDCKQDGRAEAEGPKEFVPLYPNDPDNPNKETPRQDVLREAEHLVSADRNQAYGEPTDNFATIAEMATSRFRHLLRPGARFVGSDIGDFQIITKLARNVTMKKRDSYTDMAGYAACGYECTLNED